MFGKKKLSKENEMLKSKLQTAKNDLSYLYKDYASIEKQYSELNIKYISLMSKYNKLMDSCLSSETEHITYNGELYGIQTIDYHKDTESVDTIDIRAVHIPREKGLINNLAEPFKNVAKELNKLFFGNENM